MEFENLLGDLLPRTVGLALVAVSAAMIFRVRKEFFAAVRGWIIAFFVAVVALFWLYEVGMTMTASEWSCHPLVGILFVILASWLAVFVVSATTIYRRAAEVGAFKVWLRGRPLNLVTVWGAVGLFILSAALALEANSVDRLSDEPWLLATVFAYLLLSILISMFLPFSMRVRGELRRFPREYRTSMTLLAVAWVGMPTVEFVFDLLLRSIGIDEFDPLYAWTMVLLFLMLARSVMSSRFALLIIHAEVEMGERGGFRPYDIPRGTYLIEDETHNGSMELFAELVSLPLRPDVSIPTGSESASDTLSFLIPKGLIITRTYPDRIREVYNLQVTPIIWLTESPGDKRVSPTSVTLLTDTVIRFMESNPNSIVLLDGIEYLMTFNDFNRVLRSLDSLNETVWITKSRLLISLNPRTLEQKQPAMIERDRIVVKGANGLERLKRGSEQLAEMSAERRDT